MNSTDRVREAYYNHLEDGLHKRDLVLAWLTLHYENGGVTHPDDRRDPQGGYAGWHMLLAEKIVSMKVHDCVMYPSFLFQLKPAMMRLEEFHADDEEGMLQEKVDTISDFLTDMDKNNLAEMVDALSELICFHAWSPEDIFEALTATYEVFSWIYTL